MATVWTTIDARASARSASVCANPTQGITTRAITDVAVPIVIRGSARAMAATGTATITKQLVGLQEWTLNLSSCQRHSHSLTDTYFTTI